MRTKRIIFSLALFIILLSGLLNIQVLAANDKELNQDLYEYPEFIIKNAPAVKTNPQFFSRGDTPMFLDAKGNIWRHRKMSSSMKILFNGVKKVTTDNFDAYALRTDGTVWYIGWGGIEKRNIPFPVTDLVGGNSSGPIVKNKKGEYFHVNSFQESTKFSAEDILTNQQLALYHGDYRFLNGKILEREYLNRKGGGFKYKEVKGFPSKIIQLSTSYSSLVEGINSSLLAVDNQGNLWGYGSNEAGQLCHSNLKGVSKPTKVMENVKRVSVYDWRSLILMKDGTVKACGENNAGELGDGSEITPTIYENSKALTPDIIEVIPHSKPVKVHGLSNVVVVAATAEGSYAIRSDGSFWGWGASVGGSNGQTVPVRLGPHKAKLY